MKKLGIIKRAAPAFLIAAAALTPVAVDAVHVISSEQTSRSVSASAQLQNAPEFMPGSNGGVELAGRRNCHMITKSVHNTQLICN
jgi:hypothetical protein